MSVGSSGAGATRKRALEEGGRRRAPLSFAQRKIWMEETLLDVCSGNSIPEVEIISLLEEQIPKYKLRADTITKFSGYENQDWFIPSPALRVSDQDLKLSPDQIRETLNYFLLCSDRVSQMTKTYDDIEAVSRLLEEKEKDLELTARIGKELLEQNGKLEATVSTLENDLRLANEKITQLTHEISKKTELIQILTNDMDESSLENGISNGRINIELMQRKISSLEDENKSLKSEFYHLVEQTDDVEAKEKSLLNEMLGELSCANSSVGYLEEEIGKVKEENRTQHEQILTLTAKLSTTEEQLKKALTENDAATSLLQITRDTQNSLALELAELKTRYLEIEGLLHDAQEQLRKARRRNAPTVRSSLFPPTMLGGSNYQVPFDNLHNELEQSIYSECSIDSGISADSIPHFRRVFNTVRCASQSSLSSGDSMAGLNMGLGGQVSTVSSSIPRLSALPQTSQFRRSSGSLYSGSSLGYPSLDSTSHSDTESSQTDSDEGYPGPPRQGIPGAPGAAELEAALKRLTPGEVLSRRSNLQFGPTFGEYDNDRYARYGCRTPDSLMSTGSYNYPTWKLPEKLQIVKPIEGSQTLHQWSQLAQPTFGGLLEERPGVKIRCGKELDDIGIESYGLSDLEEDDEYSHPGKIFDTSKPIYTLTTSTIMHPDDGTFNTTMSIQGSRISSVCSSMHNSPPATPKTHSRRNSTCTYSTNYGLAKMLNERGIKAITPSAYNTPSGPNSFTPTATPCNSLQGSPDSTRSNSPEPIDLFSLPHRILSAVPSYFQSGAVPKDESAKKRRTLEKINERESSKKETKLVKKIERIGISNLMAAPGALSLTAGMYARPDLTSPMAQLTCLLPNSGRGPTITGASNIICEDDEIAESAPPRDNNSKRRASPQKLGVPVRPGNDALNKRLEQLNSRKNRKQGTSGIRHDLGTVKFNGIKQQPPEQLEQQSSTLGTLSSLLFGRKGGLF